MTIFWSFQWTSLCWSIEFCLYYLNVLLQHHQLTVFKTDTPLNISAYHVWCCNSISILMGILFNTKTKCILGISYVQKEWREERGEFWKKVSRCVRRSQEMLWSSRDTSKNHHILVLAIFIIPQPKELPALGSVESRLIFCYCLLETTN